MLGNVVSKLYKIHQNCDINEENQMIFVQGRNLFA